MATANDLIKRAMRLSLILGTNEEPSAAEAADALSALNTLLEAWSLERLVVHQVLRTQKVLTVGDGEYTVGTGGDINIAHPPNLEDSSFVRDSTVDHSVRMINEEAYRAIGVKSVTGLPSLLFYDKQYPLGKVYLFPVPDKAYTLDLATWAPLTTFAALTTEVSLPLGYKRMLEYNLAVELAPEFGVPTPGDVVRLAGQAKAAVKRVNDPMYTMSPESAYVTSRLRGDLNTIYG